MTEAIRVLIVDDKPAVARLHSQLVQFQRGFEVCGIVHSGAAAIRAVERTQPGLVLLDFGLPDIDGREVLRRIRASNAAHLEVIALTAASDIESVRFARSAGLRHYLVKPFPVSALGERLERIRAEREMIDRSTSNKLDQEDVDAILRGSNLAPSSVAPIPKGLSPESLELVRRTLRGVESDISAGQLAHLAGMSRVTARRYLEFLCQLDEVEMAPRYGGRGRPENRYRLRLG